jgi:UDP-N-acetylmuramoyl-L-alanyl-D-glutamate--2,6-diaminopimelate ligase
LQVVGITGTSGKTCVAALFESILLEANRLAGSITSLGYKDGCEEQSQVLTDPDPSAIAYWLGRMVASGASHGIVELSSAALARSRAEGIELDAACIHNLDSDHLDIHGSTDNYRRAKWQILRHLQPHGIAVLNADDPHCCRILSDLEQPALTFGMHRPAEVMAAAVEEFVGEQTFLLEAGGDAVAVRSPIAGEHHRYNCLAAATLALGYGIDLATIARGLEQVQRIPGRIDRVEFGQPFGLWLDAADSPHQLRATLSAVRHIAHGRVICVVVPRPDNCRTTQRKLQQVVRRLSEQSVIMDVQRRDQRQLRSPIFRRQRAGHCVKQRQVTPSSSRRHPGRD